MDHSFTVLYCRLIAWRRIFGHGKFFLNALERFFNSGNKTRHFLLIGTSGSMSLDCLDAPQNGGQKMFKLSESIVSGKWKIAYRCKYSYRHMTRPLSRLKLILICQQCGQVVSTELKKNTKPHYQEN